MFCSKCGFDIGGDSASFCPQCGDKINDGDFNLAENIDNSDNWIPANPLPNKKNPVAQFIIFITVVLSLLLPFHYTPYISDSGFPIIFAKEHLTFKNTFVTRKTVDNLINRYNNAGLIEQIQINNDPLMVKLREKGIVGIVEK